MIGALVGFTRAWGSRFIEVQGVDRAVAIAAQAFSALIPLLIVYSAVVSRDDGEGFSNEVIDRFDLDGATAESVHEAFTSPQTVTSSLNVVGVLLLVVAALSFSRAMQRLYESAYGLPSLGMRNTRWGLAWILMLVVYSSVRPFVSGLVDRPVLQAAASLALGIAVWTATPYLLLGRRLHWKTLLPGAVAADLGMAVLAVTSYIWVPRTIEASADQFGVMGVAFALLSWLVAAGFVVVAAATGGAVTTERLAAVRSRT